MNWLLDDSGFAVRSNCGEWTVALAASYQIANAVIALAYFAITVALWVLWYKRRADLPKTWMLIAFMMFISLCGLTHVFDVAVFYWAPYRLFTLVSTLLAIAAATTALLLPRVVKHLLGFPCVQALYDEQAKTAALLQEKIDRNAKLAQEADKLRDMLQTLRYKVLTEDKYEALRDKLSQIRAS